MRRQAAISKCKKYCEGAWSVQENQIYFDFLAEFHKMAHIEPNLFGANSHL